MSVVEGSDAIAGEGGGMSSMLPSVRLEAVLQALENGSDVTVLQNDFVFKELIRGGGAVLRKAAEKGLVKAVNLLLRRKDILPRSCTNEGAADFNYITPLHLAAAGGHVAVVEALISSGALVNVENKKGETPLYWACLNDQGSVVNTLIKHKAIVEKRNSPRPILAAVQHCRSAVAEALFNAGASSCGVLGAVFRARRADIFGVFLKHFAACISNDTRALALFKAVSMGRLDICQPLVDTAPSCSGLVTDLQRFEDARMGWHSFGSHRPGVLGHLGGLHDPISVLDHRDSASRTPLLLASEAGHLEIVSFLISRNADINARDIECRTPLHVAAMAGHPAIVHLLPSLGADIEARDGDQRTALHHASVAGHLEVVRVLLSSGADIEARDGGHWTALHCASSSGRFSIVQLLLINNAKADAVDKYGSSPLDLAIEKGYRDISLLLFQYRSSLNKIYLLNSAIKHGRNLGVLCSLAAGIESFPNNYLSPLHTAIDCGHIEFVNVLLEKGAAVNAKNHDGDTPLLSACLQSCDNVLELLLKHGASTNSMNSYGQTPLMTRDDFTVQQMLIKYGADISIPDDDDGCLLLHRADSIRIVQLLLQNNALVDARDHYGATPLHYACRDRDTAVAKLLIEHGASVSTRNKKGDSPLMIAVTSGNPSLVQLLLENDADINAVYDKGRSVLHYAFGFPEVMRLLLECDVDVNAEDVKFKTPLHRAAKHGSLETVRLLIDHGAEVNALDHWSRTPLHLAGKRGAGDIFDLLLQSGADEHAVDINGKRPTKHHIITFYRSRSPLPFLFDFGFGFDYDSD